MDSGTDEYDVSDTRTMMNRFKADTVHCWNTIIVVKACSSPRMPDGSIALCINNYLIGQDDEF